MTLRVFAAEGPWAPGSILTLDPSESHYLLRVRRATKGHDLEVLDGVESCWRARLHQRQGSTALVELSEPVVHPPTVPLDLLLVVPEPRATLEALTNASELGAHTVWLVRGDHSPGGVPSPERIAKTVRAAQRQCGRPRPLAVQGPLPLGEALARSSSATAKGIGTAMEGQAGDRPGYVASAPDRAQAPTSVELCSTRGGRLLIGPEGGLSDQERQLARQVGLRPLSLGPFILRTPTAVTAGLGRLWAAAGTPGGSAQA